MEMLTAITGITNFNIITCITKLNLIVVLTI